MENTERSLSILMLPWLAHGHTSPYLELAKKLTNKYFYIYLCSTPANLESIKKKLGSKYSDSIQLIELHLPCLPQLPEHYHTTNGLPPHLMSTLKQAFEMSSPAISNILETLKPNLLVFDFNQPWAATLANSYNIPAVEFVTFTPSMVSLYLHYHGYLPDFNTDYPFQEIYLNNHEHVGFEQLKGGDEGRLLQCIKRSSKIVLFKTFREIEGKYLDYLEASLGKKMVATGPLVENHTEEAVPVLTSRRAFGKIDAPIDHEHSTNVNLATQKRRAWEGDDEEDCKDEFTRWLDKKEPLSTVFVSFGTEYYSSKEEMKEIAMGLESSQVNFIWVVRFPLGESNNNSLHQALPHGFMERVKSKGIVVEGWAPQMRILEHPSIGGFVSHCGTSSVMESLKLGVPIIALPMHLDQPLNARLVVSLGVGVEVERDGEGRLRREEIERVVRRVVVDENGKEFRRKAKEMSCLMVKKGDEDIDVVAKELAQLCKEAKRMQL